MPSGGSVQETKPGDTPQPKAAQGFLTQTGTCALCFPEGDLGPAAQSFTRGRRGSAAPWLCQEGCSDVRVLLWGVRSVTGLLPGCSLALVPDPKPRVDSPVLQGGSAWAVRSECPEVVTQQVRDPHAAEPWPSAPHPWAINPATYPPRLAPAP